MGFAENFIAAFQSGQQAKRAKDREAQEDEERKLRISDLKLDRDRLLQEDRWTKFTRQRTGDKEAAAAREGLPLAQQPQTVTPTGGQLGSGLFMMMPEFKTKVEPATIRGSEEFGIPSITHTPQTQEQTVATEVEAMIRKAMLTPQSASQGERITLPMTGQVLAEGAPKPPNFQSKGVTADGFSGLANFDPAEGAYYAPGSKTPLTNVKDAPPQADPNLDAMRKINLELARQRLESGGDFSPRQVVTFSGIANAADRSPLIKAADRTRVLDDAIKTIEQSPKDPAAQLRLSYSYIQALDTYISAVREGELGNLGELGTKLQQWKMQLDRVATNGAFLNPDVALNIAKDAKQLVTVIKQGRDAKMREFGARAQVSGVGDMWQRYTAAMGESAGDGETSGQPNVGDTKTFPNGNKGTWDGQGWVQVQ